ncbi:MAG TPA: DNA-processing protein DprA [Candidatus Dormibacteraeota bacterium]|jgi:DNA processing protein|nr:DNA-processing protein DprA [Candidatus Dormibacteraeota bacterium]
MPANTQGPAEIRRLPRGSPGWPAGLEHLDVPPAELWVRGVLWPPPVPAVAVVGARRATVTGLDVARELGRELAAAGVLVISGLARGVDAAAHRGALEGGGPTLAVLGCGVDVCYPPGHEDLLEAVCETGAVISEDPPGTEPVGWRFPRRNRLIAALCLAVVVVEATERSGALSTARHAADLGREILAVPGSVRSPQSRGTNRLIRDGAVPLLELDDLAGAVPELPLGARPPGRGRPGRPPDDPALRTLLQLVGCDPIHPDQLAEATGAGAAEIAVRLCALELGGWVQSLPGGRVARVPAR